MRKPLALLCAVLSVLLLLISCAPGGGGELEKKPGTVEDNRVIGAEKESESAPASSSAPRSSVPPESSVPPATVVIPSQSGTVRDDQEAAFRLRLEWTASVEGGAVTVNTELFIDCYSLTVRSRKGGEIVVNGEKRSFSTEAINQTENKLTSIPVDSAQFTFALQEIPPQGIPVEAKWNFNGTYGGQTIEALTLSETIVIGG